jgi:hypothetical protein
MSGAIISFAPISCASLKVQRLYQTGHHLGRLTFAGGAIGSPYVLSLHAPHVLAQ